MNKIEIKPSWFVGTMGFSYKDWEGVFYPRGMKPKEFLSYYSRIFRCVEIDSTFYGTPPLSTISRWRDSVGEDFRFCLKTPRLITHDLRLTNTRGLMDEFVDTVKELQGKLGVILLQFPPSFTLDQYEMLKEFILELPSTVRYAIEVRHRSWYSNSGEKLASLLKQHNICWASTVFPFLPEMIIRTTDLVYIRWIGRHGTFSQHDLERIDRKDQLIKWHKMILSQGDENLAVYGHFNNDYSGFAVGTAIQFLQLTGRIPEIPQEPVQGKMF